MINYYSDSSMPFTILTPRCSLNFNWPDPNGLTLTNTIRFYKYLYLIGSFEGNGVKNIVTGEILGMVNKGVSRCITR